MRARVRVRARARMCASVRARMCASVRARSARACARARARMRACVRKFARVRANCARSCAFPPLGFFSAIPPAFSMLTRSASCIPPPHLPLSPPRLSDRANRGERICSARRGLAARQLCGRQGHRLGHACGGGGGRARQQLQGAGGAAEGRAGRCPCGQGQRSAGGASRADGCCGQGCGPCCSAAFPAGRLGQGRGVFGADAVCCGRQVVGGVRAAAAAATGSGKEVIKYCDIGRCICDIGTYRLSGVFTM